MLRDDLHAYDNNSAEAVSYPTTAWDDRGADVPCNTGSKPSSTGSLGNSGPSSLEKSIGCRLSSSDDGQTSRAVGFYHIMGNSDPYHIVDIIICVDFLRG